MRSAAALLALVSAVAAQQGFNYGATNNDGSVRAQGDYENLFNAAKNLAGTSGFSSARLYTMIQGSTTNTPTSAIQAAIDTKTHLLLGLWGSAGQANIDNEIAALKAAIQQYGSAFTDLIDGISVGSEDLYRVSPTGIENKSGAGATPDELVSYINQVRSTISGTSASGAKIGHVDTWTAWVNGSNAAVINAVDWLGMDGYPYYQTTQANGIENGASLFFDSYNATVGVSGGKPVWITETGWPYQGPTANQAVASTQNAETYWQEVACRVLGNIPTWWYTLYDPQAFGALSFGLQSTVGGAPVYDLTCSAGTSKVQSSSAAPSSSAVSTKAATSSAAVNTPQSSSAVAPPVVSSSAASSVATPVVTSVVSEAGGKTYTHFQTTLVTITSCPSGCAESTTLAAPTTRPFPSSSAPAPSSTGKSCPTNLNGQFEYPHLIVPVDSANPDKAYGTSYNGEINPTVSSIFNFDIPASYAGKTCSLVFLFPEQSQLETSSFTFNNKGGVKVSELTGPATTSTTFNNAPAAGGLSGSIASVAPGNSYLVASQACAAGQRIGFEFSSTGGLDLEYFQDFNPSPIGAYITVC